MLQNGLEFASIQKRRDEQRDIARGNAAAVEVGAGAVGSIHAEEAVDEGLHVIAVDLSVEIHVAGQFAYFSVASVEELATP